MCDKIGNKRGHGQKQGAWEKIGIFPGTQGAQVINNHFSRDDVCLFVKRGYNYSSGHTSGILTIISVLLDKKKEVVDKAMLSCFATA